MAWIGRHEIGRDSSWVVGTSLVEPLSNLCSVRAWGLGKRRRVGTRGEQEDHNPNQSSTTRPLTQEDIPNIIQQVLSTLFPSNHREIPPSAESGST